MVFLVFIGGVLAAILAIFSQAIFESLWMYIKVGLDSLTSITFAAFAEEFFKFLIVYFLIRQSKYFDEPIDAMIYMITIAAGFAAVENMAVMFGNAVVHEKIGVLALRFLGATLLHVMSSALLGFYWAKGIIKKKEFLFIVIGLVSATLLHVLFNYLIVLKGVLIYSLVVLVMAAFLVFYDFEKIKKDGKIKLN